MTLNFDGKWNKRELNAKVIGGFPLANFHISYLFVAVVAVFRNLHSTRWIGVCACPAEEMAKRSEKKFIIFLSMHKLKLKPKLQVN